MEVLKNLLSRRKSYKAKDGAPSMRALVFAKDGKQGKVELGEGVRIPTLNTTQVLVKVHAAALNAVDLENKSVGEPVGVEFVGTIEKLGWIKGDHVHMFPFAIGDVVLGMCASGALSEFVCADADKISFAPDAMADEQAASFSVSGLTAHQGLMFNQFGEGKTIMVIGASNATGAMFVRQAQLLKAAKVIVADTADKAEFAEELGADAFVDLDSQALEDVVGPAECDLVVDALTDPSVKDARNFEKECKPLVVKGGRFLLLKSNPLDQLLKVLSNSVGLNVQRGGFDTVLLEPRQDEIKQLADWFEQGLLQQSIDSVVDMADTDAINAAYGRIKASQVRGKVVIRIV